ncbi:MAG: CBS domain-containing protein [Desulfovibrio piger]|nr:CBS domain-containing protein [Desulfovibrio piger]MCI7615832.1 CBS domain-containing protein [Desulfovibrio piger]
MIREDLLRTVRDLSARHDTKAFAELVESVHPSDMAEALETLKSRDVARLLPCLKAGALAEVFVYFSEERQIRLLQELPRETVVALFEGMAADERVDLFHDLDEAARQRLLPALAHGEREDILRLAAYAEGSVGSVTTSDYVAVLPDMSVAQALTHVRATAADKETIYVIYVQDKEGHLCGTLSLRELLLADDSLTIRNTCAAIPCSHGPSGPGARPPSSSAAMTCWHCPSSTAGKRWSASSPWTTPWTSKSRKTPPSWPALAVR